MGIIHLSPESASRKINEIWSNIDSWWNSWLLQDARKKFCDNYAFVSETPIQNLKKILEEISIE